jgi:heterodisulfide reductase subunit C
MTGKTPLKIRNLVYSAVVDYENIAEKDDFWYCTVCYLCHERCPQGIKLLDLIMTLRNLSIERKGPPTFVQNAIKLFLKSGMSFPTGGYTKKLREKLDLPPLNTCVNDEKALSEVLTIAKATGLGDSAEDSN